MPNGNNSLANLLQMIQSMGGRGQQGGSIANVFGGGQQQGQDIQSSLLDKIRSLQSNQGGQGMQGMQLNEQLGGQFGGGQGGQEWYQGQLQMIANLFRKFMGR